MKKIVVFSGAGISAESGLRTFRDSGGLWENYRIEDVATPQAWERDPQTVLDFYNARREQMKAAMPNAAHKALADLEKCYEVLVITQNVDDLHERGGSSHVLHLHGELAKARSSEHAEWVQPIGESGIRLGDTCPRGSQMRPHIVWFGEDVPLMDQAIAEMAKADVVIAVGSSLSVYPAASLVNWAPPTAVKYLVAPDVETPPSDYYWLRENAAKAVPQIVDELLTQAQPTRE